MRLLNDDELERSSVVANCHMNRERALRGSNGYERDLRFDAFDWLRSRFDAKGEASWLDLCCGTGKALREAGLLAESGDCADRVSILGVDLVDPGAPFPGRELSSVRFIEASIARWVPEERFDLITCVHGLHYLGDKFGVVQRFVERLKDGGLFTANFDLRDIRIDGLTPELRKMRRSLADAGLAYDSRRKLLRSEGLPRTHLPYRFLGADDSQGPNYTGQPAVVSHYAS